MNNKFSFDANNFRKEFPIFNKKINGKDLIFLDTAASAQKPQCVIDSVNKCYSENYANIHRGVYHLSANLTSQYERVREKVAKFINAKSNKEIIFTKSATEALNLIASCLYKDYLKEDDEILLTYLEHHANIVPWQINNIGKKTKLVVADLNDDTTLNIEDLIKKISKKTKLISITHMSNSLGHINDIKKVCNEAKKRNIPVVVDGCQYIAHGRVNVAEIGCDFYVFSGHKIYGPSGIGVLYGKQSWLENLPPYQGGGDMIERVTFEKTTFAELPQKFEAGTPPIAQVIGLGSAIDYVKKINVDEIYLYQKYLYQYAYESLRSIPSLNIIGHSDNKGGILSFTLDYAHTNDVGVILDQEGIAIRTGHHCTQPLMKKLGIDSTARASFGLYNTKNDIDRLSSSLKRMKEFFNE
ncbi:MAG: Cysteine desulfurase SufS [Alphaproteobacteria bacterium MarineAlpha5_Bin11]|nr:cysteine desulfurase CsdA [Pelagibacteraceae bacterium]PPR44100.1 MAG: Cysteine desulfurase SufS [Alphaproteobacteria bacterium MarineAlpha5_Bin11]PPR51587.1 MAG: Cysteine desulfurase SufS [Alphaproteobacteria bacterium MarineAlpha5_Bin10]|tara:strand:+ start:3218 stop:4453 length:1236 start_codon:yes stop_codon:yes gene_type:complete